MKKLLVSILLISTGLSFASQESDLARKAGGGNKFGRWLKSKAITNSGSVGAMVETSGVSFDSSEVPESSCTRKEQTSLPLWVFEDLIEFDEIAVGTNSATDTSSGMIQLTGGQMIGNCNAMLKMSWDINEGGSPHYFNVSVKRPVGGCKVGEKTGKTLCPYSIQLAEDGITQDERKTYYFEPNYYGFMACMKKAGVYNDNGDFDGSKVALADFSVTKTGVDSTGPIQYYCKGAECASSRSSGQRVPNRLARKNICEHATQINSTKPKIYSRIDSERMSKEEDFRRVCHSMDYKTISARLPSFENNENFRDLYETLRYVRDELILKKVKILAKAIKDKKSLKQLNAEQYNDVLSDFYRMIIVPTRKEIEMLYKELGSETNKNRMKMLQAKIDKKVDSLKRFTGKGFFNSAIFEKMKSFPAKAPLHKKTWVAAAQSAYKGINTAYNYARFHSKLGSEIQAKKTKQGLVYELDLTPADANRLISKHINDEADHLEKLATLASDPTGDTSYAGEHLAEAEDIQVRHQMRVEGFQHELLETRQAQSECYNSRIGFYGFLAQSCVEDNQKLQQEIVDDISYYTNPDYQQYVLSPTIQNSMNKANYWAGIERDRNIAYGLDPRPRVSQFSKDRRSFQRPNFSQNFSESYLQNQSMARQSLRQSWGNGLNRFNNQSPWQNSSFMQNRLPANQNWFQNPNSQRPFTNQNWPHGSMQQYQMPSSFFGR